MNIQILAETDAVIIKTGIKIKVQEEFPAYQTPTKVSRSIMKEEDKISAYKRWVSEGDYVVEEKIYAEYDVFCEKLIGVEKIDYGALHLKELERFIEKYTKDGYKIKVEMI